MVHFIAIFGKHSNSFLRNALNIRRPFSVVSSTLNNANKVEDQVNGVETGSFDKDKFDNLVQRCYVYDASYSIYGGCRGFTDLGPVGSGLKSNILQLWRQQFVLKERMFEIDCPTITIPAVLKASGHIQRFNDYIVKDVNTGDGFRLDHLIKAHLDTLITTDKANAAEYKAMLGKLDDLTMEEMGEILTKFDIKSPKTGNDLTQPEPYNLMFGTGIGHTQNTNGFLRPELAQSAFVNFKQLSSHNHGHLPFAVAQIATAFRNEISPRQGLLRSREFALAEIQHFFDPMNKTHRRFDRISNTRINLYSACNQMNGQDAQEMTIGEAVEKELVANEILGYFLVKIQNFLLQIGISKDRLRFRQHLSNEMAHYAEDCWDAECLVSSGWIECVGCADRAAYDLEQHEKASGIELKALRKFSTPKQIDAIRMEMAGSFLNRMKTKRAKKLRNCLKSLTDELHLDILETLKNDGHFDLTVDEDLSIRLNESSIKTTKVQKTIDHEFIMPHVIEPSFGINRIVYALLEHSFRNSQYAYFGFTPLIAPQKCGILPLNTKPEFDSFIDQISDQLTDEYIPHRIEDISGSIGWRYKYCDEIGIPFAITLDYDTLNEHSHPVTLRERDTKEQLSIPIVDIIAVIKELSCEKISWPQLCQKYPKYERKKSTE